MNKILREYLDMFKQKKDKCKNIKVLLSKNGSVFLNNFSLIDDNDLIESVLFILRKQNVNFRYVINVSETQCNSNERQHVSRDTNDMGSCNIAKRNAIKRELGGRKPYTTINFIEYSEDLFHRGAFYTNENDENEDKRFTDFQNQLQKKIELLDEEEYVSNMFFEDSSKKYGTSNFLFDIKNYYYCINMMDQHEDIKIKGEHDIEKKMYLTLDQIAEEEELATDSQKRKNVDRNVWCHSHQIFPEEQEVKVVQNTLVNAANAANAFNVPFLANMGNMMEMNVANMVNINQGNFMMGLNQVNMFGVNQENLMGMNQNNIMSMNQGNIMNMNQGNIMGMNQNNMMGMNQNNMIGMNQGNMMGMNQNNIMGMNQNNMMGMNQNNIMGMNQGNMMGMNQGNMLGMNQNNMMDMNQSNDTRINMDTSHVTRVDSINKTNDVASLPTMDTVFVSGVAEHNQVNIVSGQWEEAVMWRKKIKKKMAKIDPSFCANNSNCIFNSSPYAKYFKNEIRCMKYINLTQSVYDSKFRLILILYKLVTIVKYSKLLDSVPFLKDEMVYMEYMGIQKKCRFLYFVHEIMLTFITSSTYIKDNALYFVLLMNMLIDLFEIIKLDQQREEEFKKARQIRLKNQQREEQKGGGADKERGTTHRFTSAGNEVEKNNSINKVNDHTSHCSLLNNENMTSEVSGNHTYGSYGTVYKTQEDKLGYRERENEECEEDEEEDEDEEDDEYDTDGEEEEEEEEEETERERERSEMGNTNASMFLKKKKGVEIKNRNIYEQSAKEQLIEFRQQMFCNTFVNIALPLKGAHKVSCKIFEHLDNVAKQGDTEECTENIIYKMAIFLPFFLRILNVHIHSFSFCNRSVFFPKSHNSLFLPKAIVKYLRPPNSFNANLFVHLLELLFVTLRVYNGYFMENCWELFKTTTHDKSSSESSNVQNMNSEKESQQVGEKQKEQQTVENKEHAKLVVCIHVRTLHELLNECYETHMIFHEGEESVKRSSIVEQILLYFLYNRINIIYELFYHFFLEVAKFERKKNKEAVSFYMYKMLKTNIESHVNKVNEFLRNEKYFYHYVTVLAFLALNKEVCVHILRQKILIKLVCIPLMFNTIFGDTKSLDQFYKKNEHNVYIRSKNQIGFCSLVVLLIKMLHMFDDHQRDMEKFYNEMSKLKRSLSSRAMNQAPKGIIRVSTGEIKQKKKKVGRTVSFSEYCEEWTGHITDVQKKEVKQNAKNVEKRPGVLKPLTTGKGRSGGILASGKVRGVLKGVLKGGLTGGLKGELKGGLKGELKRGLRGESIERLRGGLEGKGILMKYPYVYGGLKRSRNEGRNINISINNREKNKKRIYRKISLLRKEKKIGNVEERDHFINQMLHILRKLTDRITCILRNGEHMNCLAIMEEGYLYVELFTKLSSYCDVVHVNEFLMKLLEKGSETHLIFLNRILEKFIYEKDIFIEPYSVYEVDSAVHLNLTYRERKKNKKKKRKGFSIFKQRVIYICYKCILNYFTVLYNIMRSPHFEYSYFVYHFYAVLLKSTRLVTNMAEQFGRKRVVLLRTIRVHSKQSLVPLSLDVLNWTQKKRREKICFSRGSAAVSKSNISNETSSNVSTHSGEVFHQNHAIEEYINTTKVFRSDYLFNFIPEAIKLKHYYTMLREILERSAYLGTYAIGKLTDYSEAGTMRNVLISNIFSYLTHIDDTLLPVHICTKGLKRACMQLRQHIISIHKNGQGLWIL